MGGIGWQRLPDDLPDEARELAEELRMLFGSLELSMRRYALRCHCDVSTVSRYLNGLHTPPWSFIEGLLSHAAQGRAETVTQEAATHLPACTAKPSRPPEQPRARPSNSTYSWSRPTRTPDNPRLANRWPPTCCTSGSSVFSNCRSNFAQSRRPERLTRTSTTTPWHNSTSSKKP